MQDCLMEALKPLNPKPKTLNPNLNPKPIGKMSGAGTHNQPTIDQGFEGSPSLFSSCFFPFSSEGAA